MLGFRTSNIQSARQIIAPAIYQLNVDNYFNFYISNIQILSGSCNVNKNNCSFKILLNSVNGSVMYLNQYNSYEQYLTIPQNTTIEKLSIQIYDRFGYTLNSNGSDFSFTLSFEFY
jgi:hypothetical protein